MFEKFPAINHVVNGGGYLTKELRFCLKAKASSMVKVRNWPASTVVCVTEARDFAMR